MKYKESDLGVAKYDDSGKLIGVYEKSSPEVKEWRQQQSVQQRRSSNTTTKKKDKYAEPAGPKAKVDLTTPKNKPWEANLPEYYTTADEVIVTQPASEVQAEVQGPRPQVTYPQYNRPWETNLPEMARPGLQLQRADEAVQPGLAEARSIRRGQNIVDQIASTKNDTYFRTAETIQNLNARKENINDFYEKVDQLGIDGAINWYNKEINPYGMERYDEFTERTNQAEKESPRVFYKTIGELAETGKGGNVRQYHEWKNRVNFGDTEGERLRVALDVGNLSGDKLDKYYETLYNDGLNAATDYAMAASGYTAVPPQINEAEIQNEYVRLYHTSGQEAADKYLSSINDWYNSEYQKSYQDAFDRYINDSIAHTDFGSDEFALKQKTKSAAGKDRQFYSNKLNTINDYEYAMANDPVRERKIRAGENESNNDKSTMGVFLPNGEYVNTRLENAAEFEGMLPEMSQTEIDTYHYLRGTSADDAKEYLRALQVKKQINKTASLKQSAYEFGQKHKWLAAAANVAASTVGGVASLPMYAAQYVNEKTGGEYIPNEVLTGNNPLLTAKNAMHQGALDSMESGVGKFAYNAGLSIINNVAGIALYNKYYPLVMSMNAAGEETHQGLERGLSKGAALFNGTLAGSIEYLTEKMFFDDIMEVATKPLTKNATSKIRNLAKASLANAGSEFGEEAVGALAQNITDTIVAGDKSHFNEIVNKNIAEGMNKDDATRDAFLQLYVLEPLQNGVAGAISGGVLGGGYHYSNMMQYGAEVVNSNIGDVFLTKAMTAPDNTKTKKIAVQITNDLKAGKRVDTYAYGNLRAAMNEEGYRLDDNEKVVTNELNNVYMKKGGGVAGTVAASRLSWSQYQYLDELGKKTGKNIVIKDYVGEDDQIDANNGRYVAKDNTVYISANSENPILDVAKHEIFHAYASTESGQKFMDWINNTIEKSSPEAYQAEIQKKKDQYANIGEKVTKREAQEEIAADAAWKMLPRFTDVARIAGEDVKAAKKIKGVVVDLLNAIDGANAKMDGVSGTVYDGVTRDTLKQIRRNFEMALGEQVTEDAGNADKRSFAGVKSEVENDDAVKALDEAVKMEMRGDTPETIWKKTGWVRGLDQQWRYEIDDSNAKIHRGGIFSNPDVNRYKELEYKFITLELSEEEHEELKMLSKNLEGVRKKPKYLREILEHDALFAAYPQLKDVIVEFKNLDGIRGEFDGEKITIGNSLSKDKALNVLLHEVQHAIQRIEGFSKGSNVGYWEKQGYDTATAQKMYKNTAGEIEARDVQNRQNMTDEERRNNFPESMQKRENVVFSDENNNYLISSDFIKNYNDWIKSGKKNNIRLYVGTTSEALRSIDVKKQNIYWDSSKINKTLKKHTYIDDNILKQIPKLLENPIIIMKSKNHNSRLTMFGEVYDYDGLPIMAVIELLPFNKKGIMLDEIKVVSTHSRKSKNKPNNMMQTQNMINTSDIYYINPDKKRTDNWLVANRLQLPLHITKYGPINKITYPDVKVNTFSENNSEPDITKALSKSEAKTEPDITKVLSGKKRSFKNNASETKVNLPKEDGFKITIDDVKSVQDIGERKSVNAFNSKEIKATEKFARKYFEEMGVKSPFFRAWFGDWREFDLTPIHIVTKKESVRGAIKNDDTGWNINNSSKLHNELHNNVGSIIGREYLPYANDIIKNSILLNSEVSNKGKNSVMFHNFYALAQKEGDNGERLIKLIVEELYNPNGDTIKRGYKLVGFKEISPVVQKVHPNNGLASSLTGDNVSISDLFDLVKTFDKDFKPNSSSVVVNADGTPKVVYHQTSNLFTIFDPRHKGAGTRDHETPFGIFMKSTPDNIGLKGNFQMPLYASITNPLNANDRADLVRKLKQISSDFTEMYDKYTEVNREYKRKQEEAEKKLTDYLSEWRKNNPSESRRDIYNDETFNKLSDIEDEIIDEWDSETEKLEIKIKEVITEALKQNKYDGVYLKNDVGSFGRKTDTYIALDSNQVKSATDNIGTFDKNNPDIRYSIKENPTKAKVNLPSEDSTNIASDEEEDNKKTSAVYKNSIMSKDTYKSIQSEAEARKPEFMYDGITNKETYSSAQRKIKNTGEDKATADLLAKAASGEAWTADDTAAGLALMAHYQTNGDPARAVDIASAMRQKLTQAGQAIQAMAIIDKLTPEGKFIAVSREATKANGEAEERLKKKAKQTDKEEYEGLTKQLKKIKSELRRLESKRAELAEFESETDENAEPNIVDVLKGEAKTRKKVPSAEQQAKEQEEIEAKLKQAESDLADAFEEYDIAEADKDAVNEQLKGIRKEISEIKAKTKKDLQSAASKEQKIKESEEERERLFDDYMTAEELKNKLSDELSGIRKEISEIKAKTKAKLNQAENNEQKIKDAEAKLQEVQAEYEKAKAEADRVKGELKARVDEIAATKKEIEKINRSTEPKLKKLQKGIASIEKATNTVEMAGKEKQKLQLEDEIQKIYDKYNVPHMSEDRLAQMQGTFQEIENLNSADDLIELIIKQSIERNTVRSKTLRKALKKQNIQLLKDVAVKQLFGMVQDLIPSSKARMWSTYQTISHLLNLQTQSRNVTSNVVFNKVETVANNISVLFDAALAWAQGKGRTVGFDRGAFEKGHFKASADKATKKYIDIALDVNTEADISGYMQQKGRTFKGNRKRSAVLRWAERTMSYGLGVTDEFSKGGIEHNIYESLKRLNNTGLTDEEIREFAREEARYRTFQDENIISEVFGKIKKALNTIGTEEFGLGDFVIKYTQVPGALLMRSLEFSPAGYIKMFKTMAEVAVDKNMTLKQQRDMSLAFGRATTGTGLIWAFSMLAKMAILINEDEEEDKEVKNLNKAEGLSGTQINLSAITRLLKGGDAARRYGDVLVTLGFLEPLSSLMTKGIALAKDDNLSPKDWLKAMTAATFEEIASMSTMQSLRDLMGASQYGSTNVYDMALTLAASWLTGFIPAPIRQTAKLLDKVQRDPYHADNELAELGGRVLSAIPGASKKVPAKVTPWGDEKTNKTGKNILDVLNAYVNPGYVNIYQGSDISSEIKELYKYNDGVMPKTPSKSMTVDGTKYEIKGKDYEAWSKMLGKNTENAVKDYMQTEEYAAMNPQEKADKIADIVNGVYADSKEQYIAEVVGVVKNKTEYDKVKEDIDKYNKASTVDGIPKRTYITYENENGKFTYELNDEMAEKYNATLAERKNDLIKKALEAGAIEDVPELANIKSENVDTTMSFDGNTKRGQKAIKNKIDEIAKEAVQEELKNEIRNNSNAVYTINPETETAVEGGDYSKNKWDRRTDFEALANEDMDIVPEEGSTEAVKEEIKDYETATKFSGSPAKKYVKYGDVQYEMSKETRAEYESAIEETKEQVLDVIINQDKPLNKIKMFEKATYYETQLDGEKKRKQYTQSYSQYPESVKNKIRKRVAEAVTNEINKEYENIIKSTATATYAIDPNIHQAIEGGDFSQNQWVRTERNIFDVIHK